MTTITKRQIDVASAQLSEAIGKEETVVLDVRKKLEYMNGHIKSAMHLDVYERNFTDNVLSLDKNKFYYLYSGAGHRSAIAADYLKRKGFQHVFNLKNGLMEWKLKGYKLDSGE